MGEVFILWDRHHGISGGVVGYASRPLADEYKRYLVVIQKIYGSRIR